MVRINSIENGIVIDHIQAGTGMKMLQYMNLDMSKDTVALIMNATSNKHGRKDIIKIENLIDVDLTALGLLDHGATVNIIEHQVLVKKIKLSLPDKVVNVLKCKNPRCVTSVEPAIPHVFLLVDPETKEYRCEYCDDTVKP